MNHVVNLWPVIVVLTDLRSYWKSNRSFNKFSELFFFSESFLPWLSTQYMCVTAIHIDTSSYCNWHVAKHVCRCTVPVTIWLHIQTSAWLIWTSCEIVMWAQIHVSSSDSESEFEDLVPDDTDDDDDGLFSRDTWGSSGSSVRAENVGSQWLRWKLT
jgi:hypothetical protein